MTSVSIISGVAARIRHSLAESKQESSWRDDADNIRQTLERINSLLKAADQETKLSEQFVDLEKQIVQLSYEIDDAVAATETGFPSGPRRKIAILPRTEKSGKSDLEALRTKLENVTNNLESATNTSNKNKQENTSVPAQTSHQAYPATPTEKNPPGLEDEVLAALLKPDLPVVCIWGKSGMGKTTLARTAFNHTKNRQRFQGFAWVPINQDFRTKAVLQAILLQLIPGRKADIKEMNEIDLTQEIFSVQKQKKCLVVLEDIGDIQDWQSIRIAFRSTTKVLITTPSEEVAKCAAREEGVCGMKPLTEAECFKLLTQKAKFDHPGKLRLSCYI
ncbi:putative disease resistance protein RXW24L [Sesamum alatum]|uniref:Disease resistance protein RXW24L n=1 Tax=Sesamum alatum TaxID=300844 RepID=A0AAE1Y2C6_9LAMI|nr:putative disease resistance protein RXW24L [Sesamum alatum]